jgi:thiol:disulfide interchange protein DsbC
LIGAASVLLAAASASAEPDAVTDRVTQRLTALWPDAVVRRLAPSPVPSLYEVELDNLILYVDPTGRYVFSGALFDLDTQENLTKTRLDAQRTARWREAWRQVPETWPIRLTPAAGRADRPKLVVFHDPDCPFCRQLHPELQKLAERGWEIAILLYPQARLHPQAREKAINVWCAPEDQRIGYLHAAMRGESIPSATCAHPIDDIVALGRRVGVTGTPWMVLNDLVPLSGYRSADELERLAQQLASLAARRNAASESPHATNPSAR